MDFIFYRGAVSGADAFDDSRKHRRAIQSGAYRVVSCLIGMGDPTQTLCRVHFAITDVRKNRFWHIALLPLQLGKVYGAAINTRWRPGFKASHRQLHLSQAPR